LSRSFKATVKENRKIADNHFLLTLQPSGNAQKPKPGNFYMLSVNMGLDPLLKRPLSIHRITGNWLQFMYRVAGKGTNILSEKKPGETLDILGPLGNVFPVNKNPGKIILVAGGIGIAPIFSLAEKISASSPVLFYGARTKDEVFCRKELKSIGIKPVLTTDDGTLGEKGNILAPLHEYFTKHASAVSDHTVYACGPGPMLKALTAFTLKNNIKSYVALEQHMACGIGTCLGCIVNTIDGYKRVCKEGPVFEAEKIVWK